MKRFLKKRWHSIPVGIILAVLAVCSLVGGVLAAYTVWTYTFQTEVLEPITVQVTRELPSSMYPGSRADLDYRITNSSPAALNVTVTWPGNDTGPVKCYATIQYIDSTGTSFDTIVRWDYDGTETFTLSECSSGAERYLVEVRLDVLVGEDAEPGDYDFDVEVTRG